MPRLWIPVATAVWVLLGAGLMIWVDLRRRPDVDVDRLLADHRIRGVLNKSGIALHQGLRTEIERAINQDQPSSRALVGVAHLPMTTRPTDRSLNHGWVTLRPRAETYTVFFLISPWKNDGSFELYTVSKSRALYRGFRHGDRVLAILKPPEQTSRVPSLFPHVEAVGVFPLRWADG